MRECRRWRDSHGWKRRRRFDREAGSAAARSAEWVPAAESGEGLFLRLSETKVGDWLAKARTLEAQFFGAHRRWRRRGTGAVTRFLGAIRAPAFAGARVNPPILVECGYAAASLRERIYSSTRMMRSRWRHPNLYRRADSEGTLGGLVTLGRRPTWSST